MGDAPRRLSIARDVIGEVLDGEAVVLDLRNGVYFSLNRVGTRIWQLISEYGDPDLIREQMLEEFDVSTEQLQRDLDHWLRELQERGLVVKAPD